MVVKTRFRRPAAVFLLTLPGQRHQHDVLYPGRPAHSTSYFFRTVHDALIGSVAVTLLALLVFGYVKGRFTTFRSAWQTVIVGGLLLTLAGDTMISLWLTTTADRFGRRHTLVVGAVLMALERMPGTSSGKYQELLPDRWGQLQRQQAGE